MRNINKKGLYLALALLCVVVLLVGACAKQAPAPAPAPAPKPAPAPAPTPAPKPAPTPTPAPKPTPAPAPAPIKLKLVKHSYGPRNPSQEPAVWACDEIERRTGGQVTFEHLFGGPLGGAQEQLKNIMTGLFDVGEVIPGYHPAELPLTNIVIVPSMTTSFHAKLYANNQLLTEQPDVVAELAKYKLRNFIPASMPNYEIISAKPIRNTADLKGLRIRGYGPMDPVLKELGAIPVSMVFTETYTALERGTVDGVLGSYPDTQFRYRLYEVGKYETRNMGFGPIGYTYMINLDTYNSLPDNIKKVFNDVAVEVVEGKWSEIRLDEDTAADSTLSNYHVDINEWSSEERAKVEELAKQGQQDWVKGLEGKGIPAQRVFDAYVQYLRYWEKQLALKGVK